MRIQECAVVMAWCACVACTSESGLAAGVTKAGIRHLELGMSESQVVALLGPPVERKEVDGGSNAVGLFYSKQTADGVYAYPFVAVVLEDGGVSVVSVKQRSFLGLDDEGVYSLTRNANPAWESPEFERALSR